MMRRHATVLGAAAALFGSATATAHDWYPPSCCSDKDCRALVEVGGESVTETAEGWQLWDGRTVRRGFARPSPDGKFHLCETGAKAILCFFAPPGSS